MARLDELWRSVDGPGVPPSLDSRRVKMRVNAALDADQAERKIYMKQKLRMALVAAAAVAALTGTAFAATATWNGLSNWFKGDPAPVQEYMDSTVRSVSDENYTMTVEGSASDESSAYLTVTITALSDEAKEFLWDEEFRGMDLFYVTPVYDEEDAAKGPYEISWSGPGNLELECQTENARRFAVDMRNLPASTSALRVWCGYMERDKQIEVPLTPAPAKTLKIGASGTGVLCIGGDTRPESEALTIDEITYSPLTLHMKGRAAFGIEPNIRVRMKDGTVYTQSQMMDYESGRGNSGTGYEEYHYRFKEIQDLGSIVSFIVFDMEYPVDGSKPTPVEHDASLDPITVTRMGQAEGGFDVPVRELTEKLGGACAWDAVTGDVTCTYRGVSIVLHAGKDTALVDGKPVTMAKPAVEQDGVLTASWDIFKEAWMLDGFVQREKIRNPEDRTDVTIIWGDWYIVP